MTDRRGRSPHPRLLAALIITIVLVAFLLVGVFPTRTYLNQRARVGVFFAKIRKTLVYTRIGLRGNTGAQHCDQSNQPLHFSLRLVLPDSGTSPQQLL